MEGITYILKAILIGILAAAPVGPIMMLTLQKSVSDGHKAGLSCGLGGTLVDTVCAIIAVFTLSGIGELIDKYAKVIELVGGAFILFVGISMFFSRAATERRKEPYSSKNFVKAATMGFSNPAALAFMIALFAFFHMNMNGQPAWVPILSIVALACGSATYWYFFSLLASRLGNRFNLRILFIVNRIAGICIAVFGLILIAKGFGA